jgi:CheY-like chemotaxis protein
MSIIVIVDDRSINRTIYAKLAQSIGSDVKTVDFGDPAEALDWLEHNRADLIITDHDMPKIDGGEFISRFRALPHAAGVPIMMVTVKDQRLLRLRALESGANDFLHSPIDHSEFLMRARNLLRLAQAVESRAGAPPPAAPEGGGATVARLDARRALAQARAKPADWRFALRLDLNSGRIAGAQALRDGRPAELADPEAVWVVLAAAQPLRDCRGEPVRFTLKARLDPDATAPAALRLASELARAGVAPSWLDLRFDAADIVAAPGRAEEEARGFEALGVGLSVDLGALARGGKHGALAGPLEKFIAVWRPALVFSCGGLPGAAVRLARRLGRGRRERPVALIAAGVDNAPWLRPLRRAGVSEAQGACFGAPLAPRDLSGLFPSDQRSALKRPA